MVFHWVSTFIPIRLLVTSQQGHKVVQYHKRLNISHDLFCIELILGTVVTLTTKFHYMSTVIFPWQRNGLQAFSKGKIRVFLLQEVLFALVVHSLGASEYEHYTAQAQESLLNSGATNKAVFTLGRWRSSNEYVAMVTS